jgi:hypothetical protein
MIVFILCRKPAIRGATDNASESLLIRQYQGSFFIPFGNLISLYLDADYLSAFADGVFGTKWHRHEEVGTSVPTLIQTGNNKRGLRGMLMLFRSSPPQEVNRLAWPWKPIHSGQVVNYLSADVDRIFRREGIITSSSQSYR